MRRPVVEGQHRLAGVIARRARHSFYGDHIFAARYHAERARELEAQGAAVPGPEAMRWHPAHAASGA
jgi:hypothetical protein